MADRNERIDASASLLGDESAGNEEILDGGEEEEVVEGAEGGEEEAEGGGDLEEQAGDEGEEENLEAGEGDLEAGDEEEAGDEQEYVLGETPDEDLEFADHPRFEQLKQIEEQQTTVLDTLSQFGIPVGEGVDFGKTVDELSLQLQDSAKLYEILDGKANVGDFLNLVVNNYPAPIGRKIVTDVVQWLKDNNVLPDEGGAGGDGEFVDPLEKKIAELEKTIKRLTGGGGAGAANAAGAGSEANKEHPTFVKAKQNYPKEMARLLSSKKVAEADHKDYLTLVANKLQGNVAAVKRIAAGNYVDVRAAFAEIHNRRNASRVEAGKNKIASRKIRTARQPKTPAGGGTALTTAAAKGKPLTREQRIAAATSRL